ncbi:MAG: hypothetical protein QG635_862 [Bacteroidota bacterium]|nr:hypothetical protein [Bacteroidota bacterium]
MKIKYKIFILSALVLALFLSCNRGDHQPDNQTGLVYKPVFVEFSGYKWKLSLAKELTGKENLSVFKDNKGNLHIKPVKSDSNWFGAEIICDSIFSYGSYSLSFVNSPAEIDSNIDITFTIISLDAKHSNDFAEYGMKLGVGSGNPKYYAASLDPNQLFAMQFNPPAKQEINAIGKKFNIYIDSNSLSFSCYKFDLTAGSIQLDKYYVDRTMKKNNEKEFPIKFYQPGNRNKVSIYIRLRNNGKTVKGYKNELILKNFEYRTE